MKEKIKFLLSGVWEFLRPLVAIFMTQAGRILADEALKVVAAVAASMGSADGDAKRQAAFDQLGENLKGRGIELGASTLYLAIETAYQKFKADTGQ